MKLVRNRIPELYPQHDYHQAGSGSAELVLLLRLKLAEEVGEVLSAPTRDALIAELADLDEVLIALRRAEGISLSELTLARAEKGADRGTFSEGWVLE